MDKTTSSISSQVLKVLAYFDIFDYPLTHSEINSFVKDMEVSEVKMELNHLVEAAIVFENKGFYGLSESLQQAEKRVEGNARADQFKGKAWKRGKLIAKFPFVKAVLISGSFSKGFMPEDGDVDYFIITKTNRMWLARTLLILFKKVFLFNSRKFFCVNYFMGDENLYIDQNNIFTAVEFFTLLPIINNKLYEKMTTENQWVSAFFDLNKISHEKAHEFNRSFAQKILEPIFNGKFGEKLDLYFMKMTLKRWQKKFGAMSQEDFAIAMKSSRNVSKHHPSNFQKKVLEEYQNRLTNLANKNVESTF